jgi:Xaa-Pro aminopeptidase
LPFQFLREGEITPGITNEEYISRRKKLLDLLPEKSVAIIAAAPVKMMTDVVPYTFRQDADYLYITGCQQPGSVAVLGHECGLCMFMPEADSYVCTILFNEIFFAHYRVLLHFTYLLQKLVL